MFRLPTQPLPITQLLLMGVRLWRKDFSVLFWLALGTVVIISLPYLVYSLIKPAASDVALLFLLDTPLFIFVLILYDAFTFSAIFYRIYMFIHDRPGGVVTALTIALQRLPYTFLAAFFIFIIVAVGFIVLFFPGVALYYYLSMCLPLVILDKENPLDAIVKSYRLVKNHWWHVFGSLMPVVFTFEILSILIYHFVSALFPDIPLFYKNFLKISLAVVYYPYFCSVYLLLFHDLKLRKQSQIAST